MKKLLLLLILVGLIGCTKSVYTLVRSEPPDASLEIAVPNSGGWRPVGQTPKTVRFRAPAINPALQRALIRVSKPGYYNEEKVYQFNDLPPEIEIRLRKVEQ